jgi:hypothetical protein
MRNLLFLILPLLFHNIFWAQEKQLPNQITLWNPYDLQFTPDNKYLVVSSPNDPKIWNLENLECINLTPKFYTDPNSTDKAWAYLPDSNLFYFQQTESENTIFSINPGGKSLKKEAELGVGKYAGFKFDNPPSFFLNSNTFLSIRKTKKNVPQISIEKVAENKPLFTSKLEVKYANDDANYNFTVLKGDENIYYLLSFRSIYYKNYEGVITEIDLNAEKTRVVAKGININVGDDTNTKGHIERLKLSTETPNFIIMNLAGLIYAVRKSDGKVLANADLKSKFPENSNPEIFGERDGKLIVHSLDLGKESGIIFDTFDFDTQTKVEQVFHFGIDITGVKEYRFAVSRNGKEFAIAYKWDTNQGFKVAYIDTQKMTMLRDKENTVENFLIKKAEDDKQREINQAIEKKETEKRLAEMSKTPKEQIISNYWSAISDSNGNRSGIELKLECDSYGNISGYFESRYTPSTMEKPAGYHTFYYEAKFKVSGKFTADNTFYLDFGDVISISEQLDVEKARPQRMNFTIYVEKGSYTYFIDSEKWGSLTEGILSKKYF